MLKPMRYIGLDIHKHYMVAAGVDADQNEVLKPQRVTWDRFDGWMQRNLTPRDAVVIEMTTNTWDVYDALIEHVQSVTVVHPPHVKAVVNPQVMTDKIASRTLAKLLAAKLLVSIWVPPREVRDLRMLVAEYHKMTVLGATAKHRLLALLQRHRIQPEAGLEIFHTDVRPWWNLLHVSLAEKACMNTDLETLAFAQSQKKALDNALSEWAAKDERVPLLVQLPGVGMLTAVTILAAIGDIRRFPDEDHLVGYAGLGASVHDSGEQHTTGHITKHGRRDLRRAMVNAANHAVTDHPYWKNELARLEPKLGRSRAIVRIARLLLVAVWHVLTKNVADKYNDARSVACSLFLYAYRVKVRNLGGMSAKQWTRHQLDRMGIGRELNEIPWGTKKVKLPPSTLKPENRRQKKLVLSEAEGKVSGLPNT
jgi:transposase